MRARINAMALVPKPLMRMAGTVAVPRCRSVSASSLP
jgi:hypothetical protein